MTPQDIHDMKTYVDANRKLTTPFDIVIGSNTAQRDQLSSWKDVGVTWWIEELWGTSKEAVLERIRQGPPAL